MDMQILQQINHWAACARLTSECSSVVHVDLLEKVADYITSIEGQLETAQKRIAELDKSETQLINERDHAESTINSMFVAVMGEKPEWSNMYQFIDAVDEVEDFVSIFKQRAEAAEARLLVPVVFSDSALSEVICAFNRADTPQDAYAAMREALRIEAGFKVEGA
ncbi:TPA: hypothetical protein PXS11_001000 [Yersinia enterocolitica]|nr:hypothetical protein [Yersinia enterocolitica]